MQRVGTSWTGKALGVFSSMEIPTRMPGGNYVPLGDVSRLKRYAMNEAISHNYLGEYLRAIGLLEMCYDAAGNPIESLVGYGEAHKIASLVANALVGDGMKLETDIKGLEEQWVDLNLSTTLALGEQRGSELGDEIYHVWVRSQEGLEDRLEVDWIDPAGYFVIERDRGRPSHVALAWVSTEEPHKDLLYKLDYKMVAGACWYREGYYKIEENNTLDSGFDGLVLREDLTRGAQDADGFAKLGREGASVTAIPVVHIPFVPLAGEDWGMSSHHYVFDAICDVFEMNADIQRGARIAALPIFYSKRDMYNTKGVVQFDPVTGKEKPVSITPGSIWDGELDLVKNAESLVAASNHRKKLVDISHESVGIPSFLFDPEKSKVVSGLALDISLFPLRSFIQTLREVRVDAYNQLFTVMLQRLGIAKPDMSKTRVNFGIFANVGSQYMNSISQLALSGAISAEEARRLLVREGIIDPELLDAKTPTPEGSQPPGDNNTDPSSEEDPGQDEEDDQ